MEDESRNTKGDVADGADIADSAETMSDRRSGPGRRGGMDRREGFERRRSDEPYEGPDRRTDWDRRRGPGRRRSDERRSAEEGEMTDEQFDFLMAIEEYKRANKRPFPSYTEVLEIAKALGYRLVAEPGPLKIAGEGV